MNERADEIRRRLDQVEIDLQDRCRRFARRLARENGWSVAFAERVFSEYERFLLIAADAPYSAHPPPLVARVWRAHGRIEPSWGGPAGRRFRGLSPPPLPRSLGVREERRRRARYAQTRKDYVRLCGAEPPEDVWPLRGAAREDVRDATRDWRDLARRPRVWIYAVVVVLCVGFGLWADVGLDRYVDLFAAIAGLAGLVYAVIRGLQGIDPSGPPRHGGGFGGDGGGFCGGTLGGCAGGAGGCGAGGCGGAAGCAA